MQTLKNHWPFYLLAYFLVIYLLMLNTPALWSPDELRYAEIPREMITSGNWVVPHFNDLRYFEKPVLGYWFNAIAQLIFGENNFSVRFASAFGTFGTAILLALFIGRETNPRQGWMTAGVFLSMGLVMVLGTYSVLDSILNLWLTATFISFYYALKSTSIRGRLLTYSLAGIFCGAAVLTKGFLALALPTIVVGVYAILQKKLKSLLTYGWLSIIAAALVCLPWALAVHSLEPDYWHYFFWIEHIQRFSSDNAQHLAPFWYYIPLILVGILPWLFVALPSLRQTAKHSSSPLIRYAFLWALLPFLIFSIAKGKLITYILPCMAPIAILLTQGLIDAYHSKLKSLKIGSYIHAGFALLVALTLIIIYLIGDVLPLESEESYKPSLLAFTLICWAGFILLSLRAKRLEWFFAAYLAAPIALFAIYGYGVILPNATMDAKFSETFIQTLAPDITPDTVIIVDRPSNMSAFNWYLKRTDIYLTKDKGEVKYGLSYPDAEGRFIEPDDLPAFIRQTQKSHPVLLELREIPHPDKDFPKSDKYIKQGRHHAFFFDKVNE